MTDIKLVKVSRGYMMHAKATDQKIDAFERAIRENALTTSPAAKQRADEVRIELRNIFRSLLNMVDK